MPNVIAVICFLIVLFSNHSYGQQRYVVFLKDKDLTHNEAQIVEFSDRSLKRRVTNGVEVDEKDILVSKNYLHALTTSGNVIHVSRWLNAVVLQSELTASELKDKFDFIAKIEYISSTNNNKVVKNERITNKSLDYGPALHQSNQINANCLHNQGYRGNDVYLAVIDAGFENMNSINYFDSVYSNNRVLDQYNFLDNSTAVYGLSGHGTAVASCIVAHKPFPYEYAGTAVNVDLALYVSEDVGSETLIEEFNLVMALERCDSVGVNIANISLGYFDYDDSTTSHVYADLDGETTIASIGVNVAFSKGIFVVTSAGNSGPSTISTPCDANDVLCVGAIKSDGELASFSSVGPAADGDVKPNVVAMGEDAWFINADGDRVFGNGTSFSSPIVSGAVACLMQAYPDKTVQQIKLSIEQSAHQFANPDNFKGYGIPDFCLAKDLLGEMAIGKNDYSMKIIVYPNPGSGQFYLKDESGRLSNKDVIMRVYNLTGKKLVEQEMRFTKGESKIDIGFLNSGVFFLHLTSDDFEVVKQIVLELR